MRCRMVAVAAMVVLCGAGSAQAAPPAQYYLALGDSLARGIQPSSSGTLIETNRGYADDLFAFYRLRHPSLRLAKLGCSGETTTTMITGGVCPYSFGSQLADAVEFLKTHRVAFVTLSIGGDNVLNCFSLAGIDETCVQNGLSAAASDLAQILALLRSAAGRDVPIVAMNYYDPFLAAWQLGPEGQALAVASLDVTLALNSLIESLYFAFKVPVADVAQAYRITDFRMAPGRDLPLNVELEVSWTWIGAPSPVGPDIHPNAVGYAVIASAFVKALGIARPGPRTAA
jgi:lysophospholipase L1-like esterase